MFIGFRKQKDNKQVIIKMVLSILILGFSFIWFIPMYIGDLGESPVCKFRFKVYTYYCHDYSGYGTFNDLIFRFKPNKYGDIDFVTQQGGIQEYFGFKPLKNEVK